MSHYHVLFGTAGYLPDSNQITETRKAAVEVMRDEREWTGELFPREEGWRRYGSVRKGCLVWVKPNDETVIPRVLEIVPCNDPGCDEEVGS